MTTESKEASYLNSLAIAHYAVGAVMMLFACIPLIHFSIGLAFVIGGDQGWFENQGEEAPPEFIGWMFMAIGALLFLIGQTVAISVIVSGLLLKKRVKYMFSFVLACVACLFMPFGTVLGIFTIIVLIKPEAKALYKTKNPNAIVV